MDVTINGLKIQIDGAGDAQIFFDAETNTVRIQVKERVVETIKVVKSAPVTKIVNVPQIVPQPYPVPVKPWVPYHPWPGWNKWTVCQSGSIITTSNTGG